MARAAYCEADVYLLDDPLSSLDSQKTGQELMKKLLLGLLSKSCRILVSHDPDVLEEADHVVILKYGRIIKQGTYVELEDSLLSLNSEEEIGMDLSAEVHPIHEVNSTKRRTFSSSSNDSIMIENIGSDHDHSEFEEDRLVETLPWSMYWKYLRSGRNTAVFVFLAMLIVSGQALLMVTDWWLARWSKMDFGHQQDRINTYVFYVLVVVSILLVFSRSSSLLLSLLKTSESLHDAMMSAVLKAQVSFFDSNPVHKILNRYVESL
jgi:ATP-binding cassette subfamily C (CFTR/MRP) protein 4